VASSRRLRLATARALLTLLAPTPTTAAVVVLLLDSMPSSAGPTAFRLVLRCTTAAEAAMPRTPAKDVGPLAAASSRSCARWRPTTVSKVQSDSWHAVGGILLMTDKTRAVVFILQVKGAYLGGLVHRHRFGVAVLSVAEDEGAAPIGVLATATALHFATRAGGAVPQEGHLQYNRNQDRRPTALPWQPSSCSSRICCLARRGAAPDAMHVVADSPRQLPCW
jgi:hypothetical protein